jgi:4-hydroxy-L-threonine phosphate dehydrogenase PdxA
MTNNKPIIGISMGDPSGIGPEIAVKALARKEIYTICKPLIVGDSNVIKDALRMTALDLKINSISEVKKALFQFGTIDVYDLKNVNMAELQYGKVSAM